MINARIGRATLFSLMLASGPVALAEPAPDYTKQIPDFACAELFERQAVGPCDVRYPTDQCPNNPGLPHMLRGHERNHFTPRIERLEGPPGFEGDIGFMLEVFPNHHRALASLARLAEKRKSDKISNMRFTASCWFVRAVKFAPDDARVREIFGLHLSHFGRRDDALKQFLAAEQLGARDANNMYNIGLMYFEKGDYDKALAYAKKAYAGGFPLPGLRDSLKKTGAWRD